MATTSEEAVSRIADNLKAGVHFSEHGQLVPIDGSQILARDVAYRGGMKRVFVRDSGIRPPDPSGVWVDDLLSAACRIVFGVKRGSCRPVQGASHFEFREFWNDPTRYKVIEDVTVEYAPSMRQKRPGDLPPLTTADRDTIHVQTSAYPGVDVASVVFASAYQALERKFGGGGLHWVPNKDTVLRFEANSIAIVNTLVPCHYTIIRNGGSSSEIVIYVTHDAARNWDMLVGAIAAECRRQFGVGAIGYSPEHGECTFTWK